MTVNIFNIKNIYDPILADPPSKGGKMGPCWLDMEHRAEEWPKIAGQYFDIIPADMWKVDV